MPKLQTGLIDYEVQFELSDAALDDIEREGKRRLDEDHRGALRQLALAWAERRAMIRPDFACVRRTLAKLIVLASRDNRRSFIELFFNLASVSENSKPSEAFVYDAILSELRISFEPAWRERVETGKISLHAQVRPELKKIRSRLQTGYGAMRGGSRDHDLGWLIARLATIYHAAGGAITASSQINPRARHADPLWVETSKFIRFAKAFVAQLPENPGAARIDIGRLIHRAMQNLRVITGGCARK